MSKNKKENLAAAAVLATLVLFWITEGLILVTAFNWFVSPCLQTGSVSILNGIGVIVAVHFCSELFEKIDAEGCEDLGDFLIEVLGKFFVYALYLAIMAAVNYSKIFL